jgi:hypothetical protein
MGFVRKALFLGTGGLSGVAGVRANSKKERTAKAAEKQVRLQRQVQAGVSRQSARPITTRPSTGSRAPSKPLGWTGATILSLFLLIFGGLAAIGASSSGEGGVAAVFGVAFVGLILVVLRKAYLNEQQTSRVAQPVPVRAEMRGTVPLAFEPLTDQERKEITATEARSESESSATEGGSIAEEIEKLAHLHAQGSLTDEEFAAAKAKTLGA